MTRGWIGFYFIIFRGHLESEPFWGSQRGQEAKEKQREVSCSRAAKDDWDGSLRWWSREIEELVLQAGDSRKRELGGGENPTQGSTPGMFIVNHIFFYSGYPSTGCLCWFMCSFIHLCCWFFLCSMDPAWETDKDLHLIHHETPRDMGGSLVLTLFMFFSTNMSPWIDPELWFHWVSIFHVYYFPPLSAFLSSLVVAPSS